MDELLLKGHIRGVELKGGKFVKVTETHIYFEIPESGYLDNNRKLNIIKDAFNQSFQLGLKIKRI